MAITDFLTAAGYPAPSADFGTPDWALWLGNPDGIITDEDEISQAIVLIATTQLGSLAMRPEYGNDILPHLDKPLNIAGPRIIASTTVAIATWEKRATVESIATAYDAAGALNLTVNWHRAGQSSAKAQTLTFALK